MKFTLTIELGNDAMQTPYDLHSAVLKVSGKLLNSDNPIAPCEPDQGRVLDLNGNTVGAWSIA